MEKKNRIIHSQQYLEEEEHVEGEMKLFSKLSVQHFSDVYIKLFINLDVK